MSQCCGSGSGIRCLFDPWIRDPEWVFSGSRIPRPYLEELFDNFLGKTFYNSLKIGPNIFLQHFKTKIIYNFVKFCGYIKRFDIKFFFTSLFCCCFWIRDPGWVKIRIRDKHPGSATLLYEIVAGQSSERNLRQVTFGNYISSYVLVQSSLF